MFISEPVVTQNTPLYFFSNKSYVLKLLYGYCTVFLFCSCNLLLKKKVVSKHVHYLLYKFYLSFRYAVLWGKFLQFIYESRMGNSVNFLPRFLFESKLLISLLRSTFSNQLRHLQKKLYLFEKTAMYLTIVHYCIRFIQTTWPAIYGPIFLTYAQNTQLSRRYYNKHYSVYNT